MMKKPLPNDHLRTARKAMHLSRKRLAELLGTQERAIERWERGEKQPSPLWRDTLCKFFQSTPEKLGLLEAQPPSIYDPMIPALPSIPLIGRNTDLAQLKARLLPGNNVALTALHGLPGIGKTAMAIALAHDTELRALFPGGILWAGLGPQSNIPATLSRWGALLGIASSEREQLHDQKGWAAALHQIIAQRHIFLVIDDAWKLEDVLALKVGGPNCAHLVTTRFPPIAASITTEPPFVMKVLGTQESMLLLQRLAPSVISEEGGVLDLVQAVGGLPLALTLMGNYLRKQAFSGQKRHIASALQRLSSANERLQITQPRDPWLQPSPLPAQTSLHSAIAVSDQFLPPQARTALYALAVFPSRPHSFTEQAALAVASTTVEVLDLLIDAGLLESSGSGRYSLHQTITDYGRLHISDSLPYERLITFVIKFLEIHKKDWEQLERESDMILVALEKAYELDKKAELILMTLAYAPFLMTHGLYAQAELHLRRAHASAIQQGDLQATISMLRFLGEIAPHQGNLGQAQIPLQEGLKLARQLGNKAEMSALLSDLGWVAEKQGNLRQAETYLQEGLELARQNADREGICGLLRGLSSVAISKGDIAQAEVYAQEGLELARQVADPDHICWLLIILAGAIYERGRFTQAEKYCLEALELARRSSYRERICLLLANLGEIASELGKHIQAEQYLREGLELARQMQHPERTCQLLCTIGIIADRQGNGTQAEAYLQEGLKLACQIGTPDVIANTLYEYGNLCLAQQRAAEANKRFHEMLNSIPEGNQRLNALAKYGLARTALLQGDLQTAHDAGRASAAILAAIGHRQAQEVQQWLQALPQ
ncbi:tetratricopeptide repeat protein [Ktedonosporobacter rubrisoli]|uniref:Tetratricopeptide repeat protein n=1 Tax=Ktedonosporobacter rubrisoli TaxID=2509675 RepID=A0A4P6JIS9_KTERU|nr:tetratricopeptide repeat protein [Ktedonosporobacter rubrisoli]QBD74997.1 tetratricopeptide repeat protein [Ktedonosporobacter rubrisoli]